MRKHAKDAVENDMGEELDRIMPLPRFYYRDWYPDEWDHVIIHAIKHFIKRLKSKVK